MKKAKTLLAVFVIGLFSLGGVWFVFNGAQNQPSNTQDNRLLLTMYKDPNCSCCTGYAAELKKRGYKVKIVKTFEMNQVKADYGIAPEKQSCHTLVADNYFIEGHVPVAAVEKLLKEKPVIDGIGLPGMPAGSPGMPGQKRASFKIYQKTGDQYQTYMEI